MTSAVRLLHFALALLLVIGMPFAGLAEEDADLVTSHGISAFGDLKYPADFPHFDYVKPDAPKGGRLATQPVLALRTFDSFNAFILKGNQAAGIALGVSDGGSLLFESLMVRAGDEPDSYYGLVAKDVTYPVDRRWVSFRLRPEARFHDGSPLTAEDVAFSLNVLKEKGHPVIVQNLRDVERVEILGPHEVRYIFADNVQTRDLPALVAALPIFSKAYYSKQPFEESSTEPPLASGPYKVGRFELGRFVEYERVRDYWAKDLPVNRGRWNFDRIRFEFYRDRNISFEAFKAGAYDLREEFTSRIWATQYDFPAVRNGKVGIRKLTNENPAGVQGWFMNMRRKKLADIRVREAISLAFDFEWTNKTIFYGLYGRTESFFQGAVDLPSSGAAEGRELELLEPYREQLPPVLFERAYIPPVTDGTGRNRTNLRTAQNLLAEAGWQVSGGALRDADGQQLDLEFLMYDSGFERVNSPYIKNLNLLGITADMRIVDPTQYQQRHEAFDFDIVTSRYTQSLTPGIELRNFFSSTSADASGSPNLSGIKNPVVDALVEEVIAARSREDLVAATRALDRVLREQHYWVPQWNKTWHSIAYWNRFAWPAIEPKYQRGILDTWWSTQSDTVTGGVSN